MSVSFPTLLNLNQNLLSPFSLYTSPKFSQSRTLIFHRNSINALSSSYQQPRLQEYEDEDHVVGDCVVFEDGIFETNHLPERSIIEQNQPSNNNNKKTNRLSQSAIVPENLVPEKWRAVQEEINITKKDRRKMKQEMEFCSRVVKKRDGLLPLRDVSLAEYLEYKNAKLAQLKPVVLDNPKFDVPVREEDAEMSVLSGRVKPKNPRKAVFGGTMDDISEFFNSGSYQPGDAASNQGPRKMFTNEEKVMLKNRIPNLAAATSGKWLPLHALAASGEFYLVDTLLKYDININATDKHGLTAVHKAIISKKQAITNYLLRNSADPFVRDKDGATLMHYAVRTVSSHTIKILLLYDVDINQSDKDGWTPLHLAVQSRRTDLVRLLLIKGADKTLKNQDGLTPLDLCLYSGQDIRSFELIKLLKLLPKSR